MKKGQVTYEPVLETAKKQTDVVILRRDEYEQLQGELQSAKDQSQYWYKSAKVAQEYLSRAQGLLDRAKATELELIDRIKKLEGE